MKILVVDDDLSLCVYLKSILEKWGHDVIYYDNANDAIKELQLNSINMLLTDWIMPGITGIELCQYVRTHENSENYIYTILLTGKNKNEDLVMGFNSGADDFITKPMSIQELEVRIKAAERVLKLEHDLLEKNNKLESANIEINKNLQYIKKDLDAAAKIQQALLPSSENINLPVRLSWEFRPANELAGDLFGFYALDDEHLAMYLIDVAGHGVPAAMLSVYLNKMLSPEKRQESIVYNFSNSDFSYSLNKPSEIIDQLNRNFYKDNDDLLYFTMVYVIINTATGEGTLCQAGHPYPLISRTDGIVEIIGHGGYPVGLFEDAKYNDIKFHLNHNDRLLLYSDGITECFDPNENAYGMQRLQNEMQNSHNLPLYKSINTIIASVEQWQGIHESNISFEDDLSLLALEMIHH